jgi:hypothetical protein
MGAAIGSVAGGIAGSFFGPAGTAIGSSLGGALGGSIGGNGGSGTPATQSSVNSLPSWLQTPYQTNVTNAQTLAQTPYNPAMNQQVAGFNPQQNQAFSGISAIQGQYQQPFSQALSQTGQLGQQATGGLDNSAFQSYMNPYIQNVLNTSNQQQFQNLGIAQNQLGEQAAGSGAFGNDRLGLAQGQLTSNALMNMNSQNANTLASGYQGAVSNYQTGINQGLSAANQMGNLATGQQAAGLQGLNALYGSGAAQQQLQQSQYNASQYNALQQAQYPWQQMANEQSIMAPAASAYGINSSTQQLAQLSPAMQGLQTGMALNGSGLTGAVGGLMNQNWTQSGALSSAGVTQDYAGNYSDSGGTTVYPTYDSGSSTEMINYRRGGLAGYAKGGAISPNTAVGAPMYFHALDRARPRMPHGLAMGGIVGYRKGGAVDPSTLTHGMRTGGLLHKAPKVGHVGTKNPKGAKGPSGSLAALQQLFSSQMGGGMPQVGAQPNPSMPSMAAPGAQQPQIGLMGGGQIPKSIGGYAKGGMVWKKEAGLAGCYADGGAVDPLVAALTNPTLNANTLSSQLAAQRANNYVNQLLGQSSSGLADGYRAGGIVGYDGGGSPPGYVPNQYGAMIPDPNGNPMSYNQNGSAYQFTPYAADQTPLERMQAIEGNAGQILNPMRAAQGLYNTVSGAGGAISNYLNTPMNQTNPQDAAAAKATQQMAKVAAISAANKAKAATAGVTPEDEAYIQQLHDTANATQQPDPQQQQGQQGPIGPFGTPMNMPAAAMAAGMTAGAGHGTSGVLAAGVGGAEQQAMQQRQYDAMAGYRNAMAQSAMMRGGADVQRANNQTADQPWKQALQAAQTQNASQATAAKLSADVLTRTTALTMMPNPATGKMFTPQEAHQQATLEAMQSMQQMQGNGQQQGSFGGQQGMGQLPPGFIRN